MALNSAVVPIMAAAGIAAGATAPVAVSQLNPTAGTRAASGNVWLNKYGTTVYFNGTWDFNTPDSRGWYGMHVRGSLWSDGDDSGHLNAKSDGYGWAYLGHIDSRTGKNGSQNINYIVGPGDVLRSQTGQIQLCKENSKWADSCISSPVYHR